LTRTWREAASFTEHTRGTYCGHGRMRLHPK